ncbi:hypothetical protein [Tenacibaculum sp. 190524A02b]|uniref:hypothetical protein n=1 Tax=Tenacibaculum vairaonense TaxID=3137860 RepID=UPI0031FB42E2
MKKEIYILILIVFGLGTSLYSQKTEIEKYYVRVDTSFISKLKKAYDSSIEELMSVLEVNNDNRENLGFGYQLKESGKGLGSISINYQILYYKNKIISYELSTYIPNKSRKLQKLYKEKLSILFDVDSDYNVEPFYFNITQANKPLVGMDRLKNNSLDRVMSPFTGTIYGNYCSSANKMLANRKEFNEVINKDNCQYLLYSKNPSTRLMAVEFYYHNKNDFNESQKNIINMRINKLRRNPILTRTCSGCIRGKDMTKKIIKELKKGK